MSTSHSTHTEFELVLSKRARKRAKRHNQVALSTASSSTVASPSQPQDPVLPPVSVPVQVPPGSVVMPATKDILEAQTRQTKVALGGNRSAEPVRVSLVSMKDDIQTVMERIRELENRADVQSSITMPLTLASCVKALCEIYSDGDAEDLSLWDCCQRIRRWEKDPPPKLRAIVEKDGNLRRLLDHISSIAPADIDVIAHQENDLSLLLYHLLGTIGASPLEDLSPPCLAIAFILKGLDRAKASQTVSKCLELSNGGFPNADQRRWISRTLGITIAD